MMTNEYKRKTIELIENYLAGKVSRDIVCQWAQEIIVSKEWDQLPFDVQDAIHGIWLLHDSEGSWVPGKDELQKIRDGLAEDCGCCRQNGNGFQMMDGKVVQLPAAEISRITCDAKLVAIRWDLIPWGLVLDIDAPISEAKKAPMRRVWLSFVGISQITWPLENSRLPDGCWFTSGAEITELPDGFTKFEVVTLTPQFDANEVMKSNPSRTLCICAKNVLVVMSEKNESPKSCGLNRSARLKLANDDEMLECVLKKLPILNGNNSIQAESQPTSQPKPDGDEGMRK